jgi:CheY-like chemotaxis protein
MKTILVIDDSQDVRELIGDALAARGFAVLLAGDGLEGLELAQEHSPDLILCDVRMPQFDGHATLAALQEILGTSMIPFVFLSGESDTEIFRKTLSKDQYLPKPFTLSELLAIVQKRLRPEGGVKRGLYPAARLRLTSQ